MAIICHWMMRGKKRGKKATTLEATQRNELPITSAERRRIITATDAFTRHFRQAKEAKKSFSLMYS